MFSLRIIGECGESELVYYNLLQFGMFTAFISLLGIDNGMIKTLELRVFYARQITTNLSGQS